MGNKIVWCLAFLYAERASITQQFVFIYFEERASRPKDVAQRGLMTPGFSLSLTLLRDQLVRRLERQGTDVRAIDEHT